MSPSREDHPLRVLREENNWTLEDVSKKTEISKSTLSNIEGGYLPKHRVRVKLALGLGLMVGQIWPDEYPITINKESEL
jgi:transcriptional regulator with XRE-family HTH domain